MKYNNVLFDDHLYNDNCNPKIALIENRSPNLKSHILLSENGTIESRRIS